MSISLTQEPPKNWLRGVLEPCLLALLNDNERYGYELSALLAEAGLGTVPGGSLYPALLRLEKSGLITSEWKAGDGGPGRKYYRLTDQGNTRLADNADQWLRFSASVQEVLEQGRTS